MVFNKKGVDLIFVSCRIFPLCMPRLIVAWQERLINLLTRQHTSEYIFDIFSKAYIVQLATFLQAEHERYGQRRSISLVLP